MRARNLQDDEAQRSALEGSVVAAHKRVVRAEADAAVAQQQGAAERATAQSLRAELGDNERKWQNEVAARLAAHERLSEAEAQLNEARKAERGAVAAAERGWQAQQGLLKQAAAQQQRLGNVALLKVRVPPRACVLNLIMLLTKSPHHQMVNLPLV